MWGTSALQTCCIGIPVLSFRLQMPLLGLVSALPGMGLGMSCAAVPPLSLSGDISDMLAKSESLPKNCVSSCYRVGGARPVQMSQLPDSLSQTIGHKRQHHKGLNPSALISPSLFLGLLVNLCCSYLTETTTACCISSKQAPHSQVLVSLRELSAVQLDKTHFYHSLLHRWDMTGTLWMHHQAFMATTALPS